MPSQRSSIVESSIACSGRRITAIVTRPARAGRWSATAIAVPARMRQKLDDIDRTATVPPMLLALAGLKGGTGRTTLAVALAAEARARGRRTLLVDLDPRADAHAWALSAGELAPTTLALPGAPAGQAERLRGLAFGHDLT